MGNYEESQRQAVLTGFDQLTSYERNVVADYLQVRGELAECVRSIAKHENQLEYEKGRKSRLTKKYAEALEKMRAVMAEEENKEAAE